MDELTEALAPGDPVQWWIGKVTAITGDTVSVSYLGGTMTKVGVVDQYIPAVNDIVHGIMSNDNGVLILGSNNTPASPPTPPAAGPTLEVVRYQTWSYNAKTGLWSTTIPAVASEYVYRPWLYQTSQFATLAGLTLKQFDVEIRMTAGNAIELFLAANPAGSGPLVVLDRYVAPVVPFGVDTWVPAPLDWGQRLIAGTAFMVGTGGGQYPATIAGTGDLRFATI